MRFCFCFLLVAVLYSAVVAQAQSSSNRARLPIPADQHDSVHPSSSGIQYHGGPVLLGTKHVYVVYYGNFTATQTGIVDNFLEHLGGSPAFNVNTTYYDKANKHISNSLKYDRHSDSYYDAYSKGHRLTGNFDTSIIQTSIEGGYLPIDSSALYVLITSPDVIVPSGSYCGYHNYSNAIVKGKNIKYSFIPDPSPKWYVCSGNVENYKDKTSPNGDIGIDSVCDTLIHEISEAVTDPDLNAWYDGLGNEVGDLCNYVYGSVYKVGNGSHANHKFGGRNYLVQEIWENKGSGFLRRQLALIALAARLRDASETN